MSTTIKTKYGTARINKAGYYSISSINQGNCGKLLHRLIFEDFYNCNIPEGWVIHHDDGNKLNNEIWNLVPMTQSEHAHLHGSTCSEETKEKISKSKKGIQKNKEHKKKIAESLCYVNNTSGYYRVVKEQTKYGMYWRYRWVENGKKRSLGDKNIVKLQGKVLARGLKWQKLDEVDN